MAVQANSDPSIGSKKRRVALTRIFDPLAHDPSQYFKEVWKHPKLAITSKHGIPTFSLRVHSITTVGCLG